MILLKTANAIAVVNDKKLHANTFFDEGSQRSYVRTEFANQLGLTPESYELLLVAGFGGFVTKQNYSVSTIGLETPSGIKHIKVFFSDRIVKPLNKNGCSRSKHDPRFQELDFANDFKEENFQVDILLGADAAYRFLGTVDERIQEPCIQQSKFGVIVLGPLSKSTTRLISKEKPLIQTNIAKSNDHFDVNSIKRVNSFDRKSGKQFRTVYSV